MHETNDIHFFALYPLQTSQISEQYIAKNNLFFLFAPLNYQASYIYFTLSYNFALLVNQNPSQQVCHEIF